MDHVAKRDYTDKTKIEGLLKKGIREAVYPGAVLFVAQKGKVVFSEAAGNRSLVPEPIPVKKDTIFDLASLTKPLATTMALMKLIDGGKIDLDASLSELIKTSPLRDKQNLTPRLLLNHSAGFTDWKPFYLDLVDHRPEDRKRVLRERLIREPLAYPPGKECLYSDLGFMVLEWVIEERAGETLPEFVQQHFYAPLGLERTFFRETLQNPPRSPFTKGGKGGVAFTEGGGFRLEEFAATEECPWRKKVIQGEVHDENAFAMGGYSGHAGLFGVVEEVYQIVNLLREHHQGQREDYFKAETVREFFKRQNIVKDCTWALGWDTPSPQDSSSGKYFSANSVGHLGFTGTSIWMDLEKDVIVIFLTNRIHPTRNNEKIRAFRPVLHDTIMEELGKNK